MSKTGVQFDSSQFDAMVKGLTGVEIKKAITRTLTKGAKILQEKTERQFRSSVNINGIKTKRVNKKGKETTKWKRLATIKIDKKEPSVKVHIMADYRAKFFEMGTKKRTTKGHKIVGGYRLSIGGRLYRKRKGKGANRGIIDAGHYFRTAQQLTERGIFDAMDRDLSKAIVAISKKKK